MSTYNYELSVEELVEQLLKKTPEERTRIQNVVNGNPLQKKSSYWIKQLVAPVSPKEPLISRRIRPPVHELFSTIRQRKSLVRPRSSELQFRISIRFRAILAMVNLNKETKPVSLYCVWKFDAYSMTSLL